MGNQVILKVQDIVKWFPQNRNLLGKPRGYVKAVNGLTFDVYKNEVFSIVGESGCGKSTLCRVMIGLVGADSGQVIYKGQDLQSPHGRRAGIPDNAFQMIFQDPYSSLNPRMTVGDLISEPMDVQKNLDKPERLRRLVTLMRQCGLDPSYMSRYPHEFSGGQRQRISIARALSTSPEIIVCDEPVSALDVSIQSQILNLLRHLQREMELTLVFVSHDLNVVHHLSHRVMVMYLGHMMEIGAKEDIFNDPRHPYTQKLLSSIPGRGVKRNLAELLHDTIPNPAKPPTGCVFHDRCPISQPICEQQEPKLKQLQADHFAACHFA